MSPKEITEFCKLDEESRQLLKMAMTELNLSARAYPPRIPSEEGNDVWRPRYNIAPTQAGVWG